MSLAATVIVPTHDRWRTLPFAVASALNQTVADIEVFVIGDGVTGETRGVMADLCRADSRVRWFDHPKHERRGEPYRHQALAFAQGRIISYLCDRDLWLPDHVERMLSLLGSCDFTHALPVRVLPDGSFAGWVVDLALAEDRRLILAESNRIPLSAVAHTLDAYRCIPRGWTTTPRGRYTDHWMWQQFLSRPECRAASGTRPTALVFSSSDRPGWTMPQWHDDVAAWSRRIAGAQGAGEVIEEVHDWVVRDRARRVSDLSRRLRSSAALADVARGWIAAARDRLRPGGPGAAGVDRGER